MPVNLATARAELGAIRFERGDRAGARALLEQAMPILRDAVLPQERSRKPAEALARTLGLQAVLWKDSSRSVGEDSR